ncbi:3-oxoadipate enol-lactonase [Rhodobacteraceae bacterium RKSG542]|uniref:3-oxoadipate enol-lactonase n=1 Tax=Pseudovibrio flavus TaxID=2529854 RepID=UPI0012BCCCE0|nr:3-oxoadipate enol-lactonase [Pseudovibrio flavus]MTI15848.1 3-oxoadipate enol-lactonase [Pseudovibrio flavus]
MQFARVDDVVLHYHLQANAPEKPVIVFSNALGADLRIWKRMRAVLDSTHTLLFYDKRGHGLSSIGEVPYTMERHADDLAGLLDHLQIKSSVVCGLSAGGMIAQCLFGRRPDLIRGLILCNTAQKLGVKADWDARIAAVDEGGIAILARGIIDRWFTGDFKAQNPEIVTGVYNMITRCSPEGYMGTCEAISQTDLTETVKGIDVPTQVFAADQDGSTDVDLVKSLADLIPGSRFDVISPAAHMSPIEQPEKMGSVIKGFLKANDL